MIIDENTGEIISFSREPPEKKTRRVEFLEHCKDKSEVISLFRKGEHKNKLMFTNYSIDTLMRTTLNKDQMQKFYSLCEMIVVRNIILEDTRDIAQHLGVSDKNLSKLMKLFEDNGLIYYYKKNVMRRGHHTILVNPTVVWRSYLHKNAKDHDTGKQYDHNTFFSRAHKNAIQKWIVLVIGKAAKNANGDRFYTPVEYKDTQEEDAVGFGYESLKEFDKWVNSVKKDLKMDGDKYFENDF